VATSVLVPLPLPVHAAYAAKSEKFEDACKNLRQPFRKIKNQQLGATIGGALLGAFVGALVGSQMKSREVVRDRYGNTRVKEGNRAGEMALTGAVAGGLAGYLASVEQHREDQAELQRALQGFDTERAQYSELGQRLADLGNCRNQQIFTVRTEFDASRITANQAQKRLDKIQTWIAADDNLIDKAAELESKSITRYAQVVAVTEGESAQNADANGQAMLARYEGDSARFQSAVEVIYEAPGTSVAPSEPVSKRSFIRAPRGANLRQSPNAGAPVLRNLPNRTPVEVRPAEVAGWAKVMYQGEEGYVASTLLSETQPAAAPRPAPKRPRPDLAPAKIAVRPAATRPQQRRQMVTKAFADGKSLRAIDAARRSTQNQQMADARNRVAAALAAAKS
jgi:uncharacterized protein YgiM (DUF1202 family)/uncharacterized protein YcfJ